MQGWCPPLLIPDAAVCLERGEKGQGGLSSVGIAGVGEKVLHWMEKRNDRLSSQQQNGSKEGGKICH